MINKPTDAIEALLRYHETGGHEGDGSDAMLEAARAELTAMRSVTPPVADDAESLMIEFYLSPSYDPKAKRPADNVKAAIQFTLARLQAPDDYCGKTGEG